MLITLNIYTHLIKCVCFICISYHQITFTFPKHVMLEQCHSISVTKNNATMLLSPLSALKCLHFEEGTESVTHERVLHVSPVCQLKCWYFR